MKLLVTAIALPAIISAALYDNVQRETYDSRRPALSNRRQDFHLPSHKDQHHAHGQNPHHHGPTYGSDTNRRGDQYNPHPHHPVPHQSGGLRGSSYQAKPTNTGGRYSGLFPRPNADSYQPGYAQPNPDRHQAGYTGPRPNRHQSGYDTGNQRSGYAGSDRNRRPSKLIGRLSSGNLHKRPTLRPTHVRGTSGRRY